MEGVGLGGYEVTGRRLPAARQRALFMSTRGRIFFVYRVSLFLVQEGSVEVGVRFSGDQLRGGSPAVVSLGI